MSLWMHKLSGNFIIAYSVYVNTTVPLGDEKLVDVKMFSYLGVALENSHGVTCIFPDSWNSHNEFEYIGEL